MTSTAVVPSLRRAAAWAAIVPLVLYMFTVGGGFYGIYMAELRVLDLILGSAVLVIWAAWAMRHLAWRPASAIWPAFAVALGAFAVGELSSRHPRLGIEYLAWSVLLAGLYLLLVRLYTDPYCRQRLAALAVVLCTGLCGVYIAVVLVRWIDWWAVVGWIATPPLRPFSESLTYGNPSAVMTLAVLLLAPTLAHLGEGRRLSRVFGVALTLAVITVTIMSGSRAGWFGLTLAAGVTAAAWTLIRSNRAALRTAVVRPAVRLAVLATVVGAVAVAAALGPSIASRVTSGGEDLRASYVAAALRMGAESPLVGTGPGTWVAQRVLYTHPDEVDYYIPHAHDIYAQTFAEFGILGVTAGVLAIACLVWLIVGAIRGADPARRRYGWGALFSTVYFGAHQLLDFYPNMPVVLFAFVLPIAWLDATSPRPILRFALNVAARRMVASGAVAAAIASVVLLAWAESSALQLERALIAANGGDFVAALPSAKAAASADPSMPANEFTLGLIAAETGDLSVAADAFRSSVAVDGLPAAWLDLGAVEYARGNDQAARQALDEALRLGNQQVAIAFGSADLLMRLGDPQAAVPLYVDAIRMAPSLAGDPYWTSTPGLTALSPRILDAALASMPPETAFDAALSAGDTARATAIAAGIEDPSNRQLAELAIAAWGGSDSAYRGLDARARARPQDTAALSWCARIAGRRGGAAAAQRYRDRADAISGGAGQAGFEMRVNDGSHVPGRPPGLTGEFYGQYTYRRPTPWDQLVPEVPHLESR